MNHVKTVYSIAVVTHECYGHGDYGNECRIVRMGSYGGGPFPPVFTNKNEAADWLALNKARFFLETRIVELELRE